MPNFRVPSLLALSGLIVFAALGLAGCDSSDTARDDTLVLYNGQHKEATSALIKGFEDKTGIHVKERNGSSNELAHQVVEEGDRSPADMIYTEESSPLIMLQGKGLLARIDDQALESIPADYRDTDNHWTGVLGRSRVIVYNPQLIDRDDLPSSVLDLTDGKWDGKFAYVPTSGAFQAQLSAMIKLKGEESAREWLEALKKHGRIYKKNTLALDAVERGSIPFGLINNYYWDRQVMEKGKDSMTSRLYFFGNHDLGDMLTVAGIGILKSSSKQDAAQKFIHYITSEEGQRILTNKSAQYPLNAEVETPADLKPFSELTPPKGTLDLGEYSDGTQAIKLLQDVGLL